MCSIEWLAGLLQGRGNMRIGSSYEITLRSKDGELLKRLQEVYGGGVSSNISTGDITWGIYGEDAIRYMQEIRPMLYGERRALVDRLLS